MLFFQPSLPALAGAWALLWAEQQLVAFTKDTPQRQGMCTGRRHAVQAKQAAPLQRASCSDRRARGPSRSLHSNHHTAMRSSKVGGV